MPTPPSSDELLKATLALIDEHGSVTEAARAADIPRATLQHRYERAAARGLLGFKPVLPGYAIKKTSTQRGPGGETQREWIQQSKAPGEEFATPEGHVVKGVSALVDPDGRVLQQWIKTKEGEIDPLAIVETLKAAFLEYAPAATPAPAPTAAADELCTLLPCNDWHVGMFGWRKEVGADWDLKIAERVIGGAVEDTIARSPSSGQCVVLGGGDLLHADNSENKTAKSGNALQVDGRYQKVVDVATKLMVRTTDAALRRHQHVILRILPGNHDEHSSVAIAYFLKAWYRNEPRVEVDVDPSLFWWLRFGQVMLGATHGHSVKIAQMPGIMAHRRSQDWGQSKFRYVHGFHLHHSAKIATEGEGVICEVHQAPIPQDAWHFGSGFLSGRSLQAITYHRDFGEIGRVRTAILDAEAA